MAEDDPDVEVGWELLTGLSLGDFEQICGDVDVEESVSQAQDSVAEAREAVQPRSRILPRETRMQHVKKFSKQSSVVRAGAVSRHENVSIDADDVLEELEEKRWQALAKEGFTEEQVQAARNRKQWKDDVYLYSYMAADETCLERENAYLKLAVALEGLNRREEAISQLRAAVEEFEDEPSLTLALAKLLFRNDEKQAAQDLCKSIYEPDTDVVRNCSEVVLADAYYISGWTAIHMDNHTMAYKIWSKGYQEIPLDPRLKRQQRKRSVWDVAWQGSHCDLEAMIGQGATFDSVQPWEECLIAYRVDIMHRAEPCLALFDADTQAKRVVFKSRERVLTEEECKEVCRIVNLHAKAQGGWSTVRQSTVPTTDVAVEDIPLLRGWLQELMDSRLKPMLVHCFPKLVDGSTIGERGERVRIHDAFIVRYDAVQDKSLSLPEHCDTSVFSFAVALNDGFEDGGTWFEALGAHGDVVTAKTGQAVAFAGPLRHAGYPISSGTRLILVLFLYVEDFNYGPYLQRACNSLSVNTRPACNSSSKRSSGSAPGSYVVYRETVELMNSLEIRVENG